MNKSKEKLWFSILAEYLSLYQSVFSTARSEMKKHKQAVVHKIKEQQTNFELSFAKKKKEKPVCDYLEQAIKTENNDETAILLNLIDQVRDSLTWEYGYNKLPEELQEKYAYSELLGPTGPILGQNLILGLVLLAPDCVYPEHSHDQIAESYLVLSGRVTLNDSQEFCAADSIYNLPGKKHKLVTTDQPCLLAYAWSADKEILTNNAMEFA